MYSSLIFLLTLAQVLVVGGSYVTHNGAIFGAAVIYGSPFYLLMTLISADSVFYDSSPLYLAIFAYHIVKYFLFFRAQMLDDNNLRRTAAIFMEGAYLALCGYYLN